MNGFNHQGILNVGNRTVTLNSAGYARLGALTSLTGGTINAPNGVAFGAGSNFLGRGTVNARVSGEAGSVIEADGVLTLGDAASPAGFNFGGELRTRRYTVTLRSSAAAGLGNLTVLGSENGVNPGTLVAANGLVVDFDEAIVGYGTISSANAPAQRTIINGVAQGISAVQPLTLTGYVKGLGMFDNVVFAGTFSPGLSPAAIYLGSASYAETGTLLLELGGLTPGSEYDQLVHSGSASFGGTLDVDLLGGFNPTSGDEFVLATYAAHTGQFATLDFPPLPGLTWSLDYGLTSVTLSVTSTLLPGDIDQDGDVDRTDAALFAPHLGTTAGAVWTTGDFDGDEMTTLHDLALQQSHFGAPLPSAAASAAVPEPATLGLVALGSFLLAWARRKKDLRKMDRSAAYTQRGRP